MKRRFSSRSFLLGFAFAIGLLAATTVVALAQEHRSSAPSRASASAARLDKPLSESLAALGQGRTSADTVPAASTARADARVASAPSGEPPTGALQWDRSRLLIGRVGGAEVGLYAIPTSTGDVCEIVLGDFDGCTSSENFSAAPINIEEADVDQVGAGRPVVVYGLALDDVASVKVIDNRGTSSDAVVGNNAFYVELKDATAWPVQAVIGLRSGSSQTIPIPGGAPPR